MPGRTPKQKPENAVSVPDPEKDEVTKQALDTIKPLYQAWYNACTHEQEFAHILANSSSVPEYSIPPHEEDYMNVKAFKQGRRWDEQLGQRIRLLIRGLKTFQIVEGQPLPPPEQARHNTMQTELDYRKALQNHVRDQVKQYRTRVNNLQPVPKFKNQPRHGLSREEGIRLRNKITALEQELEDKDKHIRGLTQVLAKYLPKDGQNSAPAAAKPSRKRREKPAPETVTE
jgi:hypothetical protein